MYFRHMNLIHSMTKIVFYGSKAVLSRNKCERGPGFGPQPGHPMFKTLVENPYLELRI